MRSGEASAIAPLSSPTTIGRGQALDRSPTSVGHVEIEREDFGPDRIDREGNGRREVMIEQRPVKNRQRPGLTLRFMPLDLLIDRADDPGGVVAVRLALDEPRELDSASSSGMRRGDASSGRPVRANASRNPGPT